MLPAAHPKGQLPIITALIHRDPLLCMGVLATLRADPRFEIRVAAEIPPLEAIHAEAALTAADVVVTDYETGMALAAHARDARRALPVMVVTQRDSEAEVRAALAQGVLGYVLAGCRLEEIVDGVLSVCRGQRYLGQSAARRIVEGLVHEPLTPRETEVLRFVVAGWSNKMVANHLGLAVGTVKCHVKAILGKLDAKSRTQAATLAQRRGLVAPDTSDTLTYLKASHAGIGARP